MLIGTHTQLSNGLWSGTTQVGQYQMKHSPTHTHPDHRTSFINFLHLLCSTASSLFSLRARQSSLTTSLQVLFGLPLGLVTCPYKRSLFCCKTNAMSSIPNLSLSSLLGNLSFSLMPHIHLTILISACWSATTFPLLTGQVSLPCNMLLRCVNRQIDVNYKQISNCCRQILTYWLTDLCHQWLTNCYQALHFAAKSFSLLQQLCTVDNGIFMWLVWTSFCY